MHLKRRKDSASAAHTVAAVEVTFRERLNHFTWAWFTVPLSSAGVALLLATTPHQFDGIITIGKVFFIFALVTFIVALIAISIRFVTSNHTIACSLVHHPHESLFFPTSILSWALLLACIQIYGGPSCGPWLPVASRVLFWIYIFMAFSAAVLQYFVLFTKPTTRLTVDKMTPAWILPVFPSLITGTVAGVVASAQSAGHGLTIVIAGVTFQGLGWMVAFLMYAIYLQRLVAHGLPVPDLRPGLFISVGPPSFTAIGLISLSSDLPLAQHYGYFAQNPQAIAILTVMADFIAIFLWALSFWFFCISIIALISGARKMSFHLVWWAIVFPNIAWAIATGRIGERLDSPGIMWVSSGMAILLVAGYLVVLVLNARAFVLKQIMMPGMDEDKFCSQHQDPGEKTDVAVA